MSLSNLHSASTEINTILKNTNSIINQIRSGNGAIGTILYDTVFAISIKKTLDDIKYVSSSVIELSDEAKETIKNINNELMQGNGTLNKMLKDSIMALSISSSINNIEKGTKAFNLNMDALKHSFLFRNYFKKIKRDNIKLN